MNINRDYLIINDVKKSNVKLDNGSIFFYITDKNTQNIFVNLVINVSNNDLIQKYANIENAEDYTLTMNIVKPDNTYKVVEGKLHDKEKAIFEFNLKEDCVDKIGTYRCELLTKCTIDDHEEITTSNKLTYKVKASVLNDLDDIVEAPEYPLVIQLFDKLSDIEQYEEDRRANELARQLAEEQRQAKHDELVADMTDRMTTIDNKVEDVEIRITSKEQAVDALITDTKADIDNYKEVKDQEIDDYKAAKDTEINEAIANQNATINAQNDKISTVENNVVAQNDKIEAVQNNDAVQNNKLDTLQNKATIHEERITVVEAKNAEQDGRLDVTENRLANIGNDITNTMQPIIDGHTARLDAIEAIDVAQNNRLDSIEAKNQQQDDRLLDIEKVNKRQDIDLKCLFTEAKNNMMDITEEGNSVYLQNSTEGHVFIDEIKGNTLVNCNKEPDKELILNGNINTSGDNTVTITEGVDGGLVDVALEGNTLVNVSKTKDSTALPLEEDLTYLYANTQYTVQFVSDKATTADITLGGTQLLAQSIVVGLNRISIATPETLVDNKLIISGVEANIREVVVTDTDREFKYFEGMKSVGECEDLEVTANNKNLWNWDDMYNQYGTTNPNVYKKFNGTLTKINDNEYSITPHQAGWYEQGIFSTPVYLKKGESLTVNAECNHFSNMSIYNLSNFLAAYTSVVNPNVALDDFIAITINCTADRDGYYVCRFWIARNQTAICRNIQVEKSSQATDYIPHQSNTQQLTHEPLRAVGDAKDRYVLIDGKWYIERNCGYRNNYSICDAWSNENLTNRRLKLFKLDNSIEEFNGINILRKVKSNKFKCVQYGYTDGQFNVPFLAYITENGNLWVSADINYTQQDMLNYIKDCQFVYELPSPQYESIDYNPLEVYSDTTHISTNSTIPTNITVKNHGFNCLLKPSTTYTISSNLGLNTVTTPSVLTEDCLRFMDTDTSDVTTMRDVLVLEGDWTTKADLIPSNFSGIESAFEQEYDVEKSKYKVNIKVANEDRTQENNITFYINEPLRGIGDVKDRVLIKDDKVVVQRNCGIRPYEDGDFGTHLTDKVNTVYALVEPTYEEVEYNDTKLFIESFKNSILSYNSNVPVTSKLYYSYSVPIVDTVAQTANISDQQDSMIIDLATQVSVMEMMLM